MPTYSLPEHVSSELRRTEAAMIKFFGPDAPATVEIEKSDTCRICGTVWPYGGFQSAYVNGREIGVMCSYRLGCEPGVRRPDHG